MVQREVDIGLTQGIVLKLSVSMGTSEIGDITAAKRFRSMTTSLVTGWYFLNDNNGLTSTSTDKQIRTSQNKLVTKFPVTRVRKKQNYG